MFEIISNLNYNLNMEQIIPPWEDNLEDFSSLHVWNYFQFENYDFDKVVPFWGAIWKIGRAHVWTPVTR